MAHQCIEFIRSSATFADTQCSYGKREQLNLETSFIDGSHIYGMNAEEAMKLRDISSGRGLLLVQSVPNSMDLLPQDPTPKPADCLDYTESRRCFRAGDNRVNQNPGLMVMHTILMREHNRIANILADLNPNWLDETIYQEARRIVVAFIQHITYNEYLPILLGEQRMRAYELYSNSGSNYFTGYNENIDPRINNEVRYKIHSF